MTEKIYKYIEAKGFSNFEGDRGVEQFSKICEDLGYTDYMSTSIHAFLADNSGALEAILQWIDEQNVKEWEEVFAQEIDDEDDEES